MTTDPLLRAAVSHGESHAENAPDSQVRPLPTGSRMHLVVVRVSPALLMLGTGAYLTLSLVDGAVLFEGEMDPDGTCEARIPVPEDEYQLKVMIEARSIYRKATILLSPSGVTEHSFT
jgi:hypothetical protein